MAKLALLYPASSLLLQCFIIRLSFFNNWILIFDFSGKRYNYTSWDGRRPIYKYIEALDRTVSSDLIKELKQ